MKRHFSVLMLFVRSTIYKAAALALLSGAVEAALFAFAAWRLRGGPPGLETVFAASFVPLGSALFFLLLCALLCFTGCDALGSRPAVSYTHLARPYGSPPPCAWPARVRPQRLPEKRKKR